MAAAASSSSSAVSERKGDSRSFVHRRCLDISHTSRPRCELCPCISPRKTKDIATENFQRILDAYEILSDERKRLIYDIYGIEGLTSGLELGPKLNKPEEIKEELERLRPHKEEEKASVHVRPFGSLLLNLSLTQFVNRGGILRGTIPQEKNCRH